jgi:TrmH family RNA methyltransferase
MIRLTGSQNPMVKEVRALKNKSDREEKGLYFIEGVRFVEEALKENAKIRYLLVSDELFNDMNFKNLQNTIDSRSIDCYLLPDSLFASISDTRAPQGILGVLDLNRMQLGSADLKGGMLILLDGIKDPGNMGTIIRTADAAGCAGVVVPEGCVDVYNPKVLRSTMGSVFHIPVYHCGDIAYAVEIIKSNGFRLCASQLDGSTSIYNADLTGSVALVIGSEAEGIGEETAKAADLLIRIPMKGRAESLNASVAAGVMIFEAMRQRDI